MTRPLLDHPSAVIVVGPTASGKSDVAMALAAAAPDGEIVAADSMQVYRRMDIGTGKPTADDRRAVVHHGLDLVDPASDFTVAEYVAAVDPRVRSLLARGGRPVVVGGTGLYLRALTDVLDIPGRWPVVRAALETELGRVGAAALHARLADLDPNAASRIEPDNSRRTIRALEVTLGGGRRFSDYGPGLDTYPSLAATIIGLRWPRHILRARIAARVRSMLAAGWLDEADALRHEPLSRSARHALGYAELFAHLRGECSLDAATDDIVLRTGQFAVRQERWFRRDPRIRWIDIDRDPVAEVRHHLDANLAGRRPPTN